MGRMPWLTIIPAIVSLAAVTLLFRVFLRLAMTALASGSTVGQQINRRALWRMKVNSRATLTRIHEHPGELAARCVDLSDYGALVLLGRPLEPGCEVVLRIPSLRLMGTGRVRHSHRKIIRYAVGIEFSGPLRRAEVGDWTIRKQR